MGVYGYNVEEEGFWRYFETMDYEHSKGGVKFALTSMARMDPILRHIEV